MDEFRDFLAWAKSKGIELNGIVPRRIPGAGVGMIATRDIEEGEKILIVPPSAIKNIDTLPSSLTSHFPNPNTKPSVHGTLALEMLLDPSNSYPIWRTVFPSTQDLINSMPLLWPPRLQSHLPLPTRKLVQTQRTKLDRDWSLILAANAADPASQTAYRHAYLLANSRTFYYSPPSSRLARDDRMAAMPVADLFNHSSAPAPATAGPPRFDSRSGCSFAARAGGYRAGEEITICYGAHSNDFLLAEYGFVLEANAADCASVDEVILPLLGEDQRERLEASGFLGNYVIDRGTVCYRTEMAVRCTFMRPAEWEGVVDGVVDLGESQGVTNACLVLHLKKYQRAIWARMEEIREGMQVGEEEQTKLLVRRWEQILELVEATIERLE